MRAVLLVLLLAAPALATPADEITPRTLPMPGPTSWRPSGCRSVPFADPVLPPRTAFRRAHGDLESGNEVDLRRAFSLALGLTAEPLLGGVSKWASTRDDLLARDAACAAADRAASAATLRSVCPESAIADLGQVDVLRRQMLDAAARGEEAGAIDIDLGRRLRWLAARVGAPPPRLPSTLAVRYDARTARYHRKAARGLGRACRLLSSATGG